MSRRLGGIASDGAAAPSGPCQSTVVRPLTELASRRRIGAGASNSLARAGPRSMAEFTLQDILLNEDIASHIVRRLGWYAPKLIGYLSTTSTW